MKSSTKWRILFYLEIIFLVLWGAGFLTFFYLVLTTPVKFLLSSNTLLLILTLYSLIAPLICLTQLRKLVETFLKLETQEETISE